MIKTIEALISVKFIHRGDKVFQHFIIDNKKGVKKYLLDSRFNIYNKFSNKIKEMSLSHNDNYTFKIKKETEDRVILEFELSNSSLFRKPRPYYFVIAGFVPNTDGCSHCLYRKQQDDLFVYCMKKEKTLNKELKRCQLFHQEENTYKT